MNNESLRQDCLAHTPSPDGYLAWHEWAEKKSKTHRQIKCEGCGLYKIWVPIKRRKPATLNQ